MTDQLQVCREFNSDFTPCSPNNSWPSTPSKRPFDSDQHSSGNEKRRLLPIFNSCISRQDSGPRRAMTPDSAQPTIRSLQSGRSLRLTENDLRLIYVSWQKIPDKQLWCERLFLKLFSIKDQMKKLMGYDGLAPKEIMNAGRFQIHCQRFLSFWQDLVDMLCSNMDDGECCWERRAEKLVNKIREVGYLHCRMPGVTFDAESWLVFKNIILESICWKQIEIRDPTHMCWSKFIAFVISEMKDAFHHAVRSRSHTF